MNSQSPALPSYAPPGRDDGATERDALRKEAEAAASSSVFFRSSNQPAAAIPATAFASSAVPASGLTGFDPQAAGLASTAAQPSDPTSVQNRQDQKETFQKAGITQTRNSGFLQMPAWRMRSIGIGAASLPGRR